MGTRGRRDAEIDRLLGEQADRERSLRDHHSAIARLRAELATELYLANRPSEAHSQFRGALAAFAAATREEPDSYLLIEEEASVHGMLADCVLAGLDLPEEALEHAQAELATLPRLRDVLDRVIAGGSSPPADGDGPCF